MAEITLKRERPALTVNIGEDQFKVPLTFNRAEFEEIGASDDQTAAINDFFKKYLGAVFDELGDDDITALLRAWTDARREMGMPDMGEPSASPE